MNARQPDRAVGRGATVSPPNRFESVRIESTEAQSDPTSEDIGATGHRVTTQLLADRATTIIRANTSPDIPFRHSINPYRGCEHGCAYCYARPTHETLGMNAGIDFEAKILVKHDAPRMLRRELARASWLGQPIAMSGVTDCYQPCERELRLTRQLLEVMHEARQPVSIVTKNALLLRDLDLLASMARNRLVRVMLSITSLDAELTRQLEPRTSAPAARLRAVRALRAAGVPVGVLVAPVIPGLTDHAMASILEAAADAGARTAGYQLLRLPGAVATIFLDWLTVNRPAARRRVEQRIRATRNGRLDDARCGCRMRGTAAYADGLESAFRVFAKKFGLDRSLPPLDESQFRRPRVPAGQMYLF